MLEVGHWTLDLIAAFPNVQRPTSNVQRPTSKKIQFNKSFLIMSIKQKFSREHKSEKDRAENRKFILIIAVSTVVLMALMYFAFVR